MTSKISLVLYMMYFGDFRDDDIPLLETLRRMACPYSWRWLLEHLVAPRVQYFIYVYIYVYDFIM